MKKIILITVVFIGFAGVSWGQEIITIEPFGKDILLKKKIKKGEIVKFKINNVNTFKINAITKSEPLNIDFDADKIFKQIIEKQEKSTPEENIYYSFPETLSDEFMNSILIPIYDYELQAEDLKYKLEEFQKKLEEFENSQIAEKEYKFIEKFSDFISTYNKIHQQIALEEKLLEQIKDSIFIIDTLVLKNNIRDYYLSVYDSSVKNAKQEIIKSLDKAIITYADLQKLYDDLNKTVEKDSVYIIGELKVTPKINRKKYFSDEMEFATKAVETISDIKNRNEIIKKAQSGINWYNKIKSADFVAYTNGEQVNDDIVIINPVLKFSNGNIAHEFKSITIKTYDGVKVNFSSGYFLSFIGDDNYSTYTDSTGIAIGAVQSNKTLLTHSLGGMVHTYWDFITDFDPALSAGASIATNGNIGFFFGGSLLFLEKNRLVFSVGYSFLKIKRLNKSNLNLIDKSNNRYEFINIKDSEIEYDNVYKGALFLGVTYNLSN